MCPPVVVVHRAVVRIGILQHIPRRLSCLFFEKIVDHPNRKRRSHCSAIRDLSDSSGSDTDDPDAVVPAKVPQSNIACPSNSASCEEVTASSSTSLPPKDYPLHLDDVTISSSSSFPPLSFPSVADSSSRIVLLSDSFLSVHPMRSSTPDVKRTSESRKSRSLDAPEENGEMCVVSKSNSRDESKSDGKSHGKPVDRTSRETLDSKESRSLISCLEEDGPDEDAFLNRSKPPSGNSFADYLNDEDEAGESQSLDGNKLLMGIVRDFTDEDRKTGGQKRIDEIHPPVNDDDGSPRLRPSAVSSSVSCSDKDDASLMLSGSLSASLGCDCDDCIGRLFTPSTGTMLKKVKARLSTDLLTDTASKEADAKSTVPVCRIKKGDILPRGRKISLPRETEVSRMWRFLGHKTEWGSSLSIPEMANGENSEEKSEVAEVAKHNSGVEGRAIRGTLPRRSKRFSKPPCGQGIAAGDRSTQLKVDSAAVVSAEIILGEKTHPSVEPYTEQVNPKRRVKTSYQEKTNQLNSVDQGSTKSFIAERQQPKSKHNQIENIKETPSESGKAVKMIQDISRSSKRISDAAQTRKSHIDPETVRINNGVRVGVVREEVCRRRNQRAAKVTTRKSLTNGPRMENVEEPSASAKEASGCVKEASGSAKEASGSAKKAVGSAKEASGSAKEASGSAKDNLGKEREKRGILHRKSMSCIEAIGDDTIQLEDAPELEDWMVPLLPTQSLTTANTRSKTLDESVDEITGEPRENKLLKRLNMTVPFSKLLTFVRFWFRCCH